MTFPTGPPMHPSMAQQDQVRHPTKAVRTVCGGQLRVPALQPCQPSNIDDNPGIVRMASSGRKQFLASILSGIRVSLQYEVWPFIFQRRRPSLWSRFHRASRGDCCHSQRRENVCVTVKVLRYNPEACGIGLDTSTSEVYPSRSPCSVPIACKPRGGTDTKKPRFQE
jgi:hypothetical protein